MGTSTKRERPNGAQWDKAADAHRRWRSGTSGETGGRRPAQALRQALTRQVDEDPESFDLQPTMRSAGVRLVDELDRLIREGVHQAGDDSVSASGAAQRVAFAKSFTDAVAGPGGTFADAAIRKAAVQAAEQLLADNAVTQVVESGVSDGLLISRDLFCAVYQMFFAHAVEQFLTTVVAEGTSTVLMAHLPVLAAIDPGGQMADWFAQNVVALLPTPCKDPNATGPSLAELGRSLVTETVDRALGLPISGGDS